MTELTQDLVQSFFNYKDGFLYWKKLHPYSHSVKIGDKAGGVHTKQNGQQRCEITLNRISYQASRLIFLYHKGYLPKIVDHKDRDTLNDRIENIRAASKSENNRNRTAAKNKTSNYLGVSFYKKYQKWHAQIKINGIVKHICYSVDEKDAAMAYNLKAKQHHGEFANLNIIQP